MRETIAAVHRELADGPFVWRYRGDDGVAGGEGRSSPAGFWLVEGLAKARRRDEAAELMERVVRLGNHVVLYAEEIDLPSGAFLGNFPQGFSHLALISAAAALGDDA